MTAPRTAVEPGQDFDADAEFDRQLQRLNDKGYPAIAGLQPDDFRDLVAPLHQLVLERKAELSPPTSGRVPFVLVITRQLVAAAAAMARTELKGKPGFVTDGFTDVDRFTAIDSVEIPARNAYVVFDVDRGADYRNVRPDDALPAITAAGRTPLTVDEASRSSRRSRTRWRRTTASHCSPRAAVISGFRRCGSARPCRSWAGAGPAIRTPGSAPPQRAAAPACRLSGPIACTPRSATYPLHVMRMMRIRFAPLTHEDDATNRAGSGGHERRCANSCSFALDSCTFSHSNQRTRVPFRRTAGPDPRFAASRPRCLWVGNGDRRRRAQHGAGVRGSSRRPDLTAESVIVSAQGAAAPLNLRSS